jgi:drug/metabolite transporter (DMT)-like permease
MGVPSTTASKAAFLTGLAVVITPFAGYLRTRRLPSVENALGIVFAGMGFFLLTFPTGGGPIGRGDLLVGACGVLFAFEIVELAERSPGHDALTLTGIQLACTCVLAGALSLLLRLPAFHALPEAAREARPVAWQGTFLWSVLYLATVGTIGTFFGQTWAQKRISATHTAIIFALEPVFASIFAAGILKERLGARGILGAVLILVGIAVSEMRFRSR